MKRIIILVLLFPFAAIAQNKPLIIEGTAPDLYITHTVAPKENYYSVGRLYNISPKEIAPFNKLELEKGLSLGQVIKVPLKEVNFSQDGASAADEALVPVYHVVKEKEGLYRIGTNYNKLPVETLKKWNNISGESVANGTKLIVGYLRVKKELSAYAGMAKQVTPSVSNLPPVKEIPKPDVAKSTEKKPETKIETKPEVKPVVKEPAPAVVKKEEKPVVKEKEPAVEKQPEPVAKSKPEPAPETHSSKNFSGGYFKNVFADQVKGNDLSSESGTAAIFKSTSGWEDGKYYCLHNGAAPGTIVKVTNKTTGKSVYAKVLDVMPDIKQNDGILIRISNAAAAELGQEDGKFDCALSYSK